MTHTTEEVEALAENLSVINRRYDLARSIHVALRNATINLRTLAAERDGLRAQLAKAKNETLLLAALNARASFDDRPRQGGIDWTDGFDAGTRAAHDKIKTLMTPEAE